MSPFSSRKQSHIDEFFIPVFTYYLRNTLGSLTICVFPTVLFFLPLCFRAFSSLLPFIPTKSLKYLTQVRVGDLQLDLTLFATLRERIIPDVFFISPFCSSHKFLVSPATHKRFSLRRASCHQHQPETLIQGTKKNISQPPPKQSAVMVIIDSETGFPNITLRA